MTGGPIQHTAPANHQACVRICSTRCGMPAVVDLGGWPEYLEAGKLPTAQHVPQEAMLLSGSRGEVYAAEQVGEARIRAKEIVLGCHFQDNEEIAPLFISLFKPFECRLSFTEASIH